LDIINIICIFHDCYSLHIFAGMDASLKNVCTTSLGITYTAYYILDRKQTTCLR